MSLFQTLSILTAPDVVAINKDSLGKQGTRVSPANATGGEVSYFGLQQLHLASIVKIACWLT